MPIENLTLVTNENIHVIVPTYIKENDIIIAEYSDMMDVILRMIRAKYFFNMDKDVLRGYVEDFTYMYCPGDEINKERILTMLEPEEDSDEESDDEEEEEGEEEVKIEDIGQTPRINTLVELESDKDC